MSPFFNCPFLESITLNLDLATHSKVTSASGLYVYEYLSPVFNLDSELF